MGTEMLHSRGMDCELLVDVESLDVTPEMTVSLLRGDHDDNSSTRSLSPNSRCLSPASKEQLRLRVNARERERMHDLNGAMDALRQVMPYAQGPSVKKISKMNTLLLARNYIVLLKRSIDEMKRLLAEVCTTGPSLPPPMTSQAAAIHATQRSAKGGHRSIAPYPVVSEKIPTHPSTTLTLPKAPELGPVFPSVPYMPVTLGASPSPLAAHQHAIGHLPCPCTQCVTAKLPASFSGLHSHLGLLSTTGSGAALQELSKS